MAPSQVHCVSDVGVRLRTALVYNLVTTTRHADKVPLAVPDKLLDVSIAAFRMSLGNKIQSKAVICPRTELHATDLTIQVVIC